MIESGRSWNIRKRQRFFFRKKLFWIQQTDHVAIEIRDSGKESSPRTDLIQGQFFSPPDIDEIQRFVHLQTDQPITDAKANNVWF